MLIKNTKREKFKTKAIVLVEKSLKDLKQDSSIYKILSNYLQTLKNNKVSGYDTKKVASELSSYFSKSIINKKYFNNKDDENLLKLYNFLASNDNYFYSGSGLWLI